MSLVRVASGYPSHVIPHIDQGLGERVERSLAVGRAPAAEDRRSVGDPVDERREETGLADPPTPSTVKSWQADP
jgi:hypothetical protein